MWVGQVNQGAELVGSIFTPHVGSCRSVMLNNESFRAVLCAKADTAPCSSCRHWRVVVLLRTRQLHCWAGIQSTRSKIYSVNKALGARSNTNLSENKKVSSGRNLFNWFCICSLINSAIFFSLLTDGNLSSGPLKTILSYYVQWFNVFHVSKY